MDPSWTLLGLCLATGNMHRQRAMPALDNLIKNSNHLISNKIVRTTTEMTKRRERSPRGGCTRRRVVSLSCLPSPRFLGVREFIKLSSVMNTQLASACARNLPSLLPERNRVKMPHGFLPLGVLGLAWVVASFPVV